MSGPDDGQTTEPWDPATVSDHRNQEENPRRMDPRPADDETTVVVPKRQPPAQQESATDQTTSPVSPQLRGPSPSAGPGHSSDYRGISHSAVPPFVPPHVDKPLSQDGSHPPYGQPNSYAYQHPSAYGSQPHLQPKAAPGFGRSHGRTALLLSGAGALLAVVLAVVFALTKPSFLFTKKLNIQAAQAEVQRVLTDEITGYGDKNVKGVTCNNGQNATVKKGDSFSCQVTVDGVQRRVTVTFLDDNGNYEVGRPN